MATAETGDINAPLGNRLCCSDKAKVKRVKSVYTLTNTTVHAQ